jgi:hypothetical protein
MRLLRQTSGRARDFRPGLLSSWAGKDNENYRQGKSKKASGCKASPGAPRFYWFVMPTAKSPAIDIQRPKIQSHLILLYTFNSGNRRFSRSRHRCEPMLASKYEDQ